ncbi:sigma-70 family RNA polymerase sigma factor [Pelagibius sp. 7325]|uniref:sigma-70 family RNA polymerase sigma factor n=1 Tax=Pelagibius sp. 7325 TaxID=3131994 RepID=UPI0030EBEC27
MSFEQSAGLETGPGIALAGLGASNAQGRRWPPRVPEDPLPDCVPDDLVEAIARRQDREAFKRLFAAFAPRVKAFARRRGAETQVAEDLAQDVMLTVWRRAAQFDRRKASASTWIFTIARNRRIDMMRREARPAFDAEDPSLQAEAEPSADESLAERRREGDLRRAVARLPETQSQLLRLAYFEDKSHGVIAEELDLPLGTVKSRIRLAMHKLRQMLKEDE